MKLNGERLPLFLLALAVAGSAVALSLAIFGRAPGRSASVVTPLRAVRTVSHADKDVRAVKIALSANAQPAPSLSPAKGSRVPTNDFLRAGSDTADALFKKTVDDLLSALDVAVASHDLSGVRQLVERFRRLEASSSVDGSRVRLSASSRRKVLGALEALGFDGLDLVIDSLGDTDPQIVADATEQIFSALRDPTLGDYRRAEIVVAAAEEMTQRGSLVQLFNQFIRMRNSVSVEALSQIYSTGTPEAKALLPRTMGAVTGNSETQTPQQLNEWLESNPDSPDDDRVYGPREQREAAVGK